MDNNTKIERSIILKRGIFDLVRGINFDAENRESDDKCMTPSEVALVFEEAEIDILKKDYECLIETPAILVEKICEEVIGQHNFVKKLVFVSYYNQVANLAEEIGLKSNFKKINLLMIGPTGCGKTSAINALKKYFKVPIVKYSADSITSAGYIGNKVEDILIRLFLESKSNLALAERGIIYIDEIDKKVTQETSAGKDINGTAVQQELLKIMEPNVIDLTLPNKTRVPFDTSKLTVILGGAFVGLEDIRRKRICKKSLGFKSDNNELTDIELMERGYIAEDIIAYGFIPEFVGRAKMIEELRKLDNKDMLKIMFEGKNSTFKEISDYLTDVLNIDLQISVKYMEGVAEELANSKTGARDLESKMINMFYPILECAFEHQSEYGMCIIDDDGMYSLTYEDINYYGEVGK